MVQMLLTIQFTFSALRAVDSYLCDTPPVTWLACMDIYITEWFMASNSGLIALVCFLVLVTSYMFTLVTIKVHFTEGHWKALSTCALHIMVITLLFVPCTYIYLWPFSILYQE
ncbi:hypothetical protein QYF61_005782 [Mycteria americana]|uniref:G-protein coupled receptors family 1 profile domain-containing protein n=1 Tax=Mycteria americana TaxID=33587 RepID=A0AAN7RMA4_MYCAM|nr:hypothetical protein QYF61_005777 [Mycteria americana]KAK4808465.1 hypothetical protein QYF61_005782 [Mycteria americana]